VADTVLTQETGTQRPANPETDMKFPKAIRHNGKGKVWAKIYAKTASYPLYRVTWSVKVDGKSRRMVKAFSTYLDAKRHADAKAKELATGSSTAKLRPKEADDALAAFGHLETFYADTGNRVSLLDGITAYCSALKRVGDRSLNDCIEGYLRTVAVVKRKDLKEAVGEFIDGRKHLGKSSNGERSKRSPVYLYNTAMWLNEFAGTFPGYAVADLTKEHLDAYIAKFNGLSAKSRNDRRAILRMFLNWAVRKDYLMQNHRLFESTAMDNEDKDQRKIDCYRVNELRAMLENAERELLPVIALGGLAGLRREEILRLKWADVWSYSGRQIDISEEIAKGRNRRLVPVCKSLALWLAPWRKATGPLWAKSPDALEEAIHKLRESLNVPSRRNGLRHGFISYHMALNHDENLTAAISGNSPQMIHDHYRKPFTKAEARKWFNVVPKAKGNVIPFAASENGK
jgi:integrase